MRPTETLKDEHKAIKLMLKIAENVCQRLERGEAVPAEHLGNIVTFIRGFADKCHHAKEEDLLFPAMERAGVPSQGGPIGVMLVEHEQGRNYVRNMTEAAEKYSPGNRRAASQFVENARNYIALLTQHIDKEDNILYEIADRRLSEKDQEDLERGFERVEQEEMGPGKHEEFEKILDLLKKIYYA
jgi:hemerythrin-like domain-containing protein